VPLWVGMGRLETESGDLPSKQYIPHHSLIRPRAELKLWLISSVAQSSLLLHNQH